MRSETLKYCQKEIEKMLSRSTTKVIFPIITFGLIKEYTENNKEYFSDADVRYCYKNAVEYFKKYLGHSLHIGGKYYDAYSSRNLPKYGVLKTINNKEYILMESYRIVSSDLLIIIPDLIKTHIDTKMGKIPYLENVEKRLK